MPHLVRINLKWNIFPGQHRGVAQDASAGEGVQGKRSPKPRSQVLAACIELFVFGLVGVGRVSLVTLGQLRNRERKWAASA